MPAEVVLLIVSRRDVPAADLAERTGIECVVFDERLIGSAACDAAMEDLLTSRRVDLVLLAGYLRKVGPWTLRTFAGRLINTHPAPLPRFGGKGMFGEHVHGNELAWIGVSLVGVVVFVVGSSGTPAWSLRGDLLAVASLLVWTAYFALAGFSVA